jgi:hypothetical protein
MSRLRAQAAQYGANAENAFCAQRSSCAACPFQRHLCSHRVSFGGT